eukprot:365092-Rhodomonas_salina.1
MRCSVLVSLRTGVRYRVRDGRVDTRPETLSGVWGAGSRWVRASLALKEAEPENTELLAVRPR